MLTDVHVQLKLQQSDSLCNLLYAESVFERGSGLGHIAPARRLCWGSLGSRQQAVPRRPSLGKLRRSPGATRRRPRPPRPSHRCNEFSALLQRCTLLAPNHISCRRAVNVPHMGTVQVARLQQLLATCVPVLGAHNRAGHSRGMSGRARAESHSQGIARLLLGYSEISGRTMMCA